MPALKVCAQPRCPELVPRGTRHCTTHGREADKQRGSKQERGYGREHQRLRRRWKTQVDMGLVSCARCNVLIFPWEPWALDHTDDRTGYLGPSHASCNNSAGGKAAHERS